MNVSLFPDLIVNGETVPHALIAAEAQHHSAPRGKPGIAWHKAARAVVIRTLLLQEAHRRGLTAVPEAVAPGRFETEEEALIRCLLEDAIFIPPLSEAAIRAEWARDPSRFRSTPLWEVSHILVACDPHDAASRGAAKARAADLAAKAHAGPAGFARLASVYSECVSKSSGGALGQLRPGDAVPEFEAALWQLAHGEITAEPVLTRYGWHVIKMDAVADRAVLPFAAVHAKLSEAMEKAAWARAAKTFVADLVARSEISGADFGKAAFRSGRAKCAG